MRMSKTLLATDHRKWRAWLEKHHRTQPEVWLIWRKKHTGQPQMSYENAVEEALCFGWIDSIIQRIDDKEYARKFTPRRDTRKWSALNLRRARKMIEEGRMTEAGMAVIDPTVLEEEPKPRPSAGKVVIPPLIRRALMASKKAWENFGKLAPSHRRAYLGWIMEAKREETRQRRVKEVIAVLEQGKKLGMK